MKRIISLLLSLSIFVSMCVCVGAVSFSDLAEEHWAYKNINTLVEEGTINGYSDGTFKPNNSVTRAEFVKMLGKWNQKYEGTYSDITENHWAYEYIMWSGLESVDGNIYPDVAIKRSDVINLIWKRNGSPKNDLAPGAIINQGTNPDATSWAYTIGLMKGDDGFNLRLDSSLSRAEAATLIVRSRELVEKNEKNNYVDVVSEEILKQTFESLDLLSGEAYKSDRVLTYGEVARMAIVFGADGDSLDFLKIGLVNSKNEPYKSLGHKYDAEMFILASNVWGNDYYTLKKIDQPATKQDTISAILYGFERRNTALTNAKEKNNYYPDCKNATSTELENIYLTYANKSGIKLYANEKLGANESVTMKEYSAFLVLFNGTEGLGVCYTKSGKENAKIITAGANMPANFLDFTHTIEDAPLALYQLKNDNISAKKTYQLANLLYTTYTGYFSEVTSLAKNKLGAQMSYTYYPALSYKQNGNLVFAAKFTLDSLKEGTQISLDTLLQDVIKTPIGQTVDTGSEFYVVFETNGPLMDIYLPYSGAFVKAVFIK